MSTSSKPIFFRTQSDIRKWFKKNHDKLTETWIGFYNAKSDKKAATYKQALDEALCFGWIDGTRKNVDSESYTNRFSPRRAKSYWSEVNTKRFYELQKLGRIHPTGLKVFNERDKAKQKRYSFERKSVALEGALEKQFKAKKKAWKFFNAQPPYYKKIFTGWVNGAQQEETRQRRLDALIKASAGSRRLDMLNPFEKTK